MIPPSAPAKERPQETCPVCHGGQCRGGTGCALDRKLAQVDARVRERIARAEAALEKHFGTFEIAFLRKTFQGRVQYVRTPEITYGREEVLPGEVRVRPSPPVIRFSRRGRVILPDEMKAQPTLKRVR